MMYKLFFFSKVKDNLQILVHVELLPLHTSHTKI